MIKESKTREIKLDYKVPNKQEQVIGRNARKNEQDKQRRMIVESVTSMALRKITGKS